MRRVAGHVPVGLKPIADVLLVVAGLNLAGLVAICGPEAAGVRGEALIDQGKLALDEAKLELGVSDDDATGRSIVCSSIVNLKSRAAKLLGNVVADELLAAIERDVLVVITELGLGGGRKDGLRNLRGLVQTLGQVDAADGAVLVVGLLARASQVAANDGLDGNGVGLLDQHGAPRQVVRILLELLRVVLHVHRDQVVGHEVGELVEPERRDSREDLALVRDLVRQDVVKRTDSVARNHQQAVAAIVDVAYLAVRIRTNLHGSHVFGSPQETNTVTTPGQQTQHVRL